MRFPAIFCALFLAALPARAADIAIALTDDLIKVDAGFSGAKIVLFGALSDADGAVAPKEGPGYDIVAVVRGPGSIFRMRPMLHQDLIWKAGPAIDIGAPELLLTSANRPLDEIASPPLRRALGLGAEAAWIAPGVVAASPKAARYVQETGALSIAESFLEHVRKVGRFREAVGGVKFRKGALFSIDVELAPATPVGDYAVEVFLFRDGALISRDGAKLSVRKVGLEREIYELAHSQPFAYGLGCVIISLVAGWLAAAAFRK